MASDSAERSDAAPGGRAEGEVPSGTVRDAADATAQAAHDAAPAASQAARDVTDAVADTTASVADDTADALDWLFGG